MGTRRVCVSPGMGGEAAERAHGAGDRAGGQDFAEAARVGCQGEEVLMRGRLGFPEPREFSCLPRLGPEGVSAPERRGVMLGRF